MNHVFSIIKKTQKPLVTLFGAVVLLTSSAAFAEEAWPTKPITIIVPAAPGGTTDIATRMLAEELQKNLGQAIVVENKAGAAGIIGSQQLIRAKPDGYTLIMGNIGPNSINYGLYETLPYKASDFTPISRVISVPNVLIVNAESEAKTVQDLVDQLKAKPNELAFGTSGAGQSPHLSAELFMLKTDTQAIHTPYKGAGPAVTALLGNQFTFMIDNLPSSLPHINSGKFRALAITSGDRIEQLPDVPTMAEAGVDDMVVNAWFGLMAPAGTPVEVVERLEQATQAALESPKVQERFSSMGGLKNAGATTSAEFSELINAEIERWKNTIESANIEKR